MWRHPLRALFALPKPALIGLGLLVVASGGIGLNAMFSTAPSSSTPSPQIPQVQVASISSLTNAAGPLDVTGTVTSLSQAKILAQTSGELVSLSRQLGDHVAAGDIIGQFDNSSQRATVQQAQGAYDAAVASLELASNTTAVNSGVTSGSAQQSLQNTRTALTTAFSSAYAALDDAVHTRADQLFANARTSNPTLTLSVPDSVLVNALQQERAALNGELADAQSVANAPGSNLDTTASNMIARVQSVGAFIANLIKAVNETPASQSSSAATLAGYQASLSAARTEVLGAISSLTSAKSAYDSAVAGAATAQNAAGSGTQSSLAAARANVASALGSLDVAKANLEKTIVRSPISGTIVSLPVNQGDYVSSYSPVATVSNPGALYVDTTVTPEDAKTLAVGNKAVINANVPGKITFIANAIGPNASGIEVKVGITGDMSALTDGEVVSLALTRSESAIGIPAPGMKSAYPIIPINAAKIEPTGAVVFTISTSSTLVAHPVTLGTILGNTVTVTQGLSGTEAIVTDARGLSAGEQVRISTSTPL